MRLSKSKFLTVIRGGRAAGITSPTQVAGLQFWLDSSLGTFQDSAKTTAAAGDGDRVGAWADQSGNGRDVLQTTDARRPTLKTNILNGRPAIRFVDTGGSEQFLTRDSLSMAGYASDFCMIVVGSISATAGAGGDSFVQWSTGSNNTGPSLFANSVTVMSFRYPNSTIYNTIDAATGPYNDDAARVLRGYNNGALAGFYINGAEINSVPWASASARTITTIHVGSLINAIYLKGDIFELLVYKPCPSAVNMTALEQYLKGKYGMSF